MQVGTVTAKSILSVSKRIYVESSKEIENQRRKRLNDIKNVVKVLWWGGGDEIIE